MAHFPQAFWSSDYAGGLGVLFGKLQQGVQENQQILTIARMRADAEDTYGQHMGDIGPATDRISDGFQRDDGASVRKAYEGVRTEMEEASRKHRKIASNIRELVVYPFGRWCEQHASRVQNSQDDLQGRVKAHDRQAENARKLRGYYFNKCRLVEDLEEEDKLAFKEPQSQSEASSSPKQQLPTPTVKIQEPDEEDDPEPIEIGDSIYQPDQMKKILMHMLDNIKLGETKVPILGTYQNVSTGADIVEYIYKNLDARNVGYAEKIGQDLITNGFLRLVGNVGNVFANSSRMNYQWRPKVFQLTGYPDKRKSGLDRSSTLMSIDSTDSPLGTVQEYLTNWNPLNNPYPNETPSQKLRREAKEADEKYKAAVKKLDLLRCTLEEAVIEHLKFMERCELDRLKAIKSVILDFSGAISNVIPSLQSTVDKMMLFQETVQPLGDLRYLLENYRTGAFNPHVQIYENYYNSVDEQTFGVDLEARARADRKRVPLIITTILTFLDNHYPLLDGDEARRAIWMVDVPLAATHRLRNEINTGMPVSPEVLEQYEVPIVASVLKLYLLELPDSLVSSTLYEIIKTIYSTPATADSTASSARISVLQNTLGQLRLANIASLDAITTHFVRLIDLTSADEDYTHKLAQSLAPCILRSRSEGALSFEEKYNYRFLRDLWTYKDTIFNELKRASSMSATASRSTSANADSRPRGFSSDESNRRANMEERNRAIIANRSRAGSPTPHNREKEKEVLQQQRHRRDSSRGPETRFPVNVTPQTPRTVAAMSHSSKQSLSVPGSLENSPVAERHAPTNNPAATASASTASEQATQPLNGTGNETSESQPDNGVPHVEKRDSTGKVASTISSINRAQRRVGGTGFVRQSVSNIDTSSVTGSKNGVPESEERRGVTLEDKPMDD